MNRTASVSVSLPLYLVTQLDELAKDIGTSRSAVVTALIKNSPWDATAVELRED